MIYRSANFDLGRDQTRMKDKRDVRRQNATVDALLERLFHIDADRRFELQILADEVGMGKTFVAMGTAFSVLEAMRSGTAPDDLRGCYQKVLVVTPNNRSLFAKWTREVAEFVKRCVKPELRDETARWFAAAPVERIDELACELRRPGGGPRVVVASMSVFGGGRLRDYDLKRRHLLGVLFRHWANRFNIEKRERLLKGAPWSVTTKRLLDFTDDEQNRLRFTEEELLTGLRQLERSDSCIEKLLDRCREIAAPFVRGRDELFKKVEHELVEVYRKLCGCLLGSDLPLVIVDEAHNWKNGPSKNSNGYRDFADLVGARSRRALLLTATPFQLRPAEMLEILKIGDHLRACPTEAGSSSRREALSTFREDVIKPVLSAAEASATRFSRAWAKLPGHATRATLEAGWTSAATVLSRAELGALAERRGVVDANEMETLAQQGSAHLDPDIRHLLREGLKLFALNADLSHELGRLVIRHRRHTGHRRFRVGAEYANPTGGRARPDAHMLHAAPGVDVRGDGELPHYLLMRCVSEMKAGKGRSSLGSSLTGCYSTLLESSEGRAIKKRLAETAAGKIYLNLLLGTVGRRQDPKHPKVREVVRSVVSDWRAGEKSLIFCFRTNTAQRLHTIIRKRIHKELEKQRKRWGGPKAMKALRTRLTGRDRDLVVLLLDRVLWSICLIDRLASLADRKITPADIELLDVELGELADIALRHRVELLDERVDRVFLHRAHEHLVAKRLFASLNPRGELKRLLSFVADEDWIRYPYGLAVRADAQGGSAKSAPVDERGVHTVYEPRGAADAERAVAIACELAARRTRAREQRQISALDTYHVGPNLWLGQRPGGGNTPERQSQTIREIHEHLLGLTLAGGVFSWQSRLLACQAVRRAVLRDSVLLRLLPGRKQRDKARIGELLVKSFFAPLPGQQESMAARIAVFLEDLLAASGDISDEQSARFTLYSATKLRGQQFAAIVSGDTDADTRERIFAGFNTPLLPEVLICTSVGQEGIDLHRHCRRVVHFDLAWNPAVLEQRTGRADRIGSKTFRERAIGDGSAGSFLEIGVPYLAGTYDERMYEELRLRAQTFEVLTGGDLVVDSEGSDTCAEAGDQEAGLRFVPLPDAMIEAMRVQLHVWREEEQGRPNP